MAPTHTTYDQFVVQSVAGAGSAAHTITIEDWQHGDAFFLLGYSQADGQAVTRAVDTAPAGGFSVTLSDNTTGSFVGNHPTGAFDGGIVSI